MALPKNQTPWPPVEFEKVYYRFREWSAWYSGDPLQISRCFSDAIYTPTSHGRFWSKKVRDERETMLHIPIPGDIASTSADLLLGEQPVIEIPEANQETAEQGAIETQDRLNQIKESNDTYSKLIETVETAAAMGGAYLKVNWDAEFKDFPILRVAQSDNAIPEWKFGFLNRVLFHKIIDEYEGVIYRHIEYHEPGLIKNALYKGTIHNIGRQIPLTEHRVTENMEEEILTGIDDIAVRYVPNMKPNRLWRGSDLGQSDYSGIEGIFDSIDDVYTSWIRDVALAKSRLMVPRHMLENEDGELKFDVDQEVYVMLETIAEAGETGSITANQFEIRAEEHYKTAAELIERAITSAGYSPQSFGLHIEGRAESGTALRARERKSLNTKQKKERYIKRPIEEILYIMLQIDREKFSNITPFRPRVQFGDSYTPDPNELADSLEKLERARSASIKTKVEMLHSDWSDEEIEAETKRIMQEQGMTVEDVEARI